MRNGGAAHKNIEAPRSINLAMPKSCIQVTSHQSLVTPNLIPSYSSLLSNFRWMSSMASDDISGTRPPLLLKSFPKIKKLFSIVKSFSISGNLFTILNSLDFHNMPAARML